MDCLYVSRLFLFYWHECLLQPYDHLLGTDWPLGSLVCDVSYLVFYHFPIWCLGSGVVLDCIFSESLLNFITFQIHVSNMLRNKHITC